MNKPNIFLQIAAISLLCASSISFTMDIIDKDKNTQKLYKFFKLTKEELSKPEIKKISPDAKFLFVKKDGGSEKLYFIAQSKSDKFLKKPLNLREVTSFKFNKNGDALLYHFEDKAAFLNLKTNADKLIGKGLKPSDYDYYGFFNNDKLLFLVDFDEKEITMYTSKDGFAERGVKLTEDELRDKKAIESKLKNFASKFSDNPIVLIGRWIEAEAKATNDGIRRALNLANDEEIENMKNL